MADYHKCNLFSNSLLQWDLKGVIFRLSNYIIYRCAALISSVPGRGFEMACLALYALFVFVICILGVRLVAERQNSYQKFKASLVLITSILSMQIACRMQAEMTGAILLIFAFAIYSNAQKTRRKKYIKCIISGMIIGLLLFLKTPLVLLSVSYLAAIIIWDDYEGNGINIQNYFFIIFGSIITILIIGCWIILENPKEIENIFAAAVYQPTVFSTSTSLSQVYEQFRTALLKAIIGIPVFSLGIIALVISLVSCVKKRKRKIIFFNIIAWMMPAIYIVLSNTYFIYHFVAFVPSAIFQLYIQICHSKQKKANVNAKVQFCLLFVSMLLLSIMVCRNESYIYNDKQQYYLNTIFHILLFANIIFCIIRNNHSIVLQFLFPVILSMFIFINWISIFSINAKQYIEIDTLINKQNISYIDQQNQILYLDDGMSTYFLGINSWLDEYYPLPLQRINENSQLSEKDYYQRAFNKAMLYEGEYIIVYERWIFGGEKNKRIHEKISNEYEKIDEFKTFSVPFDLFYKCDTSNKNDLSIKSVYRRKTTD